MFKIFPYFIFTSLLFADIFPFQTIEKANQAYESGAFQKSAMLFKSLKKETPTVVYNQANAEYKAGSYDEALKHYAEAKGVDDAMLEHNIGNTYFKKNDFNNAITHYEKALSFREDEDTRYNLALAKQKKEEQQEQENRDTNKKEEQKLFLFLFY